MIRAKRMLDKIEPMTDAIQCALESKLIKLLSGINTLDNPNETIFKSNDAQDKLDDVAKCGV